MNHQKEAPVSADVPVTGPFLSLVKALQSARTVFICESGMAEELGLEPPENWDARCRNLFFKQYEKAVAAMGVAANEQTYDALMRLQVPDEAWTTNFAELPTKFIFDPWGGMGHGGIKVTKSNSPGARLGM